MAGRNPRIIIVGAGIAGLAAAEHLLQAGVTDFKILEATSRIGGRVHTLWLEQDTDDQYHVDLGATWIHGSRGNPVFSLAKEKGLLDGSGSQRKEHWKFTRHKHLALLEDGSTVQNKLNMEVFNEVKEVLDKAVNVYKGTPFEMKDIGIRTFVEKELQEYMKEFERDERRLRECVLNSRLIWETTISGCHDMEEISTTQFGSYKECKGSHLTPTKGYESIIEVLHNDIPMENILLENAVKCIQWSTIPIDTTGDRRQEKSGTHFSPTLCCAGTSASPSHYYHLPTDPDSDHTTGPTCVVTCRNGSTFSADCVLVTSSLGHLKECHTQLFQPQLPQAKRLAIGKLGIGTVDQIFLWFDNLDFIPEGVYRLHTHWDKQDNKELEKQDKWLRKITGFYVQPCPEENLLCAWISGKEAEEMENLSEEAVGAGCVLVLKHFLKTDNIPHPTRVIRSAWHNMPYIRGSYSYIPVGATVFDIDSLAEPVISPQTRKPALLFAGEATHSSFYSTTHGALLSGQREAQRILEAFINIPTVDQ